MAREDDAVAADPSGSSLPPAHQHHESAASADDSDLAESFALDDEHRGADPSAPPTAYDHRPVGSHPVEYPAPELPADASHPPVQPGAAPAAVPDGAVPARRWWQRKPKTKRAKAPWWELPVLVLVAVVVAVLIKTFLVQPFYIPSESMETTLHGCTGCSGDRILVNKPIYHLRDPHPGDIVVFRAPTDQWFNEPLPAAPSNPLARAVRSFGQLVGLVPPDEHDLVKRVIAVGGQTIRAGTDGSIQISDNGTAGPWRTLHEPYVSSPLLGTEAAFGPVTIPRGRLWVMGDNRAHSDDSRYHYLNEYRGDATLSTVPDGNVIGKAVVIAWPPSRWRTLGTPSTFKHASAAAAGSVPVAGAAAVVLPLALIRRRRRRAS